MLVAGHEDGDDTLEVWQEAQFPEQHRFAFRPLGESEDPGRVDLDGMVVGAAVTASDPDGPELRELRGDQATGQLIIHRPVSRRFERIIIHGFRLEVPDRKVLVPGRPIVQESSRGAREAAAGPSVDRRP
jgi:hypothetical protein